MAFLVILLMCELHFKSSDIVTPPEPAVECGHPADRNFRLDVDAHDVAFLGIKMHSPCL